MIKEFSERLNVRCAIPSSRNRKIMRSRFEGRCPKVIANHPETPLAMNGLQSRGPRRRKLKLYNQSPAGIDLLHVAGRDVFERANRGRAIDETACFHTESKMRKVRLEIQAASKLSRPPRIATEPGEMPKSRSGA